MAAIHGKVSDEQRDMMAKSLAAEQIRQRSIGRGQTIDYIPGSAVINNANRIFGPGSWFMEWVGHYYDLTAELMGPDYKGDRTIAQRGRLYIYDDLVAEDIGTSTLRVSDPGRIHDEVDRAVKGALTDCMKRCWRIFGSQFGSDVRRDERDGGAQTADGTPCEKCGKAKGDTKPLCYDCYKKSQGRGGGNPSAPPATTDSGDKAFESFKRAVSGYTTQAQFDGHRKSMDTRFEGNAPAHYWKALIDAAAAKGFRFDEVEMRFVPHEEATDEQKEMM